MYLFLIKLRLLWTKICFSVLHLVEKELRNVWSNVWWRIQRALPVTLGPSQLLKQAATWANAHIGRWENGRRYALEQRSSPPLPFPPLPFPPLPFPPPSLSTYKSSSAIVRLSFYCCNNCSVTFWQSVLKYFRQILSCFY